MNKWNTGTVCQIQEPLSCTAQAGEGQVQHEKQVADDCQTETVNHTAVLSISNDCQPVTLQSAMWIPVSTCFVQPSPGTYTSMMIVQSSYKIVFLSKILYTVSKLLIWSSKSWYQVQYISIFQWPSILQAKCTITGSAWFHYIIKQNYPTRVCRLTCSPWEGW